MAEVNRVRELIDRLEARDASAEAMEQALEGMDRSSLREYELKLWYEQCGMFAERQGQLARAAKHYEDGLARFPQHPTLAVLLRQVRERNQVDVRLAQVRRAEGRYSPQAVEAALLGLSRAELRQDEAISWHLEYAAAAMHRSDRDEALSRYRAGLSEYPSAGVLRFGLGQELEARGEADAAFAQFIQTSYPSVSAELVLIMAQYALLWGRPAEGSRLVAPLLEAVLAYGEVDAHFLYVRELPAAERVVRFAIALAYQEGRETLARLESQMTRHLSVFHNAGIHELEAELHGAQTQDFERLIAVFKHELTRAESSTQGSVQQRLLAARAANGSASAGKALLRMLRKTASFQRIVAASLRHRAGNSAAERRLLARLSSDDFLRLQASDLVAYSLLPYFEHLRARYVALRLNPDSSKGLSSWVKRLL